MDDKGLAGRVSQLLTQEVNMQIAWMDQAFTVVNLPLWPKWGGHFVKKLSYL